VNILGIIASSKLSAVGDYESIATETVGSGGSATVEFTSIPATYKHLQIRAIVRGADASTNKNLYINFNSDTGSNYSWHLLFGNGSSAGSSSGVSSTAMQAQRMPANTSTAGLFGAVVADVLDYANTNKNKTVRALAAFDDNAGGYGSIFRVTSGLWMDTDAVTSIQMTMNVGNIAEHSHFALYGIKAA
jgi:predicted secreted protein